MTEAIPVFDCKTHGSNAWNGEIACSKCSRTYTTKEPSAPMHAPPRCGCGCRLLPVTDSRGIHIAKPRAGKYYSMIPACSLCFAEMPGGPRMASQHDLGSPFCTGEQCKLHGPMIRKLARRAERAAWAARKKVAGDIYLMPLPGGRPGEYVAVDASPTHENIAGVTVTTIECELVAADKSE